jgi:hypothetical protein
MWEPTRDIKNVARRELYINERLKLFTMFQCPMRYKIEGFVLVTKGEAMKVREKPGQIENNELQRLHQLMFEACLMPEELVPWLGKYFSESNNDLDISEPDHSYSRLEIMSELNKGTQFIRLGGLRTIYFVPVAEIN